MSTAVSMSPATPACSAQARLRVATDNPGSPNVQAGLSRYPVYATFGGTLGVDQNFNRLQLSAGAAIDRTDLSILGVDRRHLDQQRRPQLQSVRRPRPRQLRPDAGLETVRRNRGQYPLARPSGRPQRLSAQFQRRQRQGRHQFRVLADADRRSRGRLGGAQLRRSAAAIVAGPADIGLAGVDRNAAHHRKILRHHLDRRDHACPASPAC